MDATLPATARTSADLLRTALIERVRAANPAIVALIAPAGFGKSTLARQLVAAFPAAAVCDCRGVGSDVALARRLLPALADETPDRSASLSQSEAMLGDGHASSADRLAVALEAWKVRVEPSAFVFENTEDAIGDPGARDFLAKLLASRPDQRTVFVCSRESLRMHLSRFAPPHQILTLRPEDLAFDREEIRTIFAGSEASDESVDHVAAVSAGWPIAVLLLARFAHERRLEPLLGKLDDVAFEELHNYLADQVLGDAPDAVVDGIIAASAIPQATERDLRLALQDDRSFETFKAFLKTSPFVTHDADETYAVHPLVATTLLDRQPSRLNALLTPVAVAYETAGEYQRAAEIHLARGSQTAAADALERIEVIEDELPPPIAYSRVLASLDRPIVLRHPRLWSITALLRTYTVDSRLLLHEVETIWSHLPADASPVLRIYLYVFRVLMLSYVGEYELALGLVDEFRGQIAVPDVPTTRLHAWLLFLRSLMTARMGKAKEAERDLELAWPFISKTSFMAAGTLVTLGADIARVCGDRATERERIDRAIEIGRRTGFSNFIAFYEAEATFGAWLAGDDADFSQHAFALEAEVVREGIRGFAFFAHCARGHVGEPQQTDQAKWVACGYLIAAAGAADEATALRYADSAREAAAVTRSPFYQALAALAVAELNPARRRALRNEAEAFAERIEAPELHAAIDGITRDEDGGMLEKFVQRYRRANADAARTGILVELLTGRVLRDGEPVALAEREHALLSAIAMRAEAFSRERLTDLLWPDLAESAARNAFHVCLHRLKSRLGEDVVVRTRDGYRLRSDVRVDLWDVERRLAALRAGGRLDAASAGRLRELYHRLRASRPAKFETWEWFEQTERHLREARCEVAQVLAKHALDEGRTQEALALCHEMIAYDPCDEPAREIAIRAYIASGDRAAALRHFRQYRDVLQAELQCEPSGALAELVGATN